MKGSVYKRCRCPVERDAKGRRKACKKAHGSWTFVADLGIDPATGKRRQVRKSGFRTSDDAQEELSKYLTSVANGQVAHDNRITVAEYLNQWIATKAASGIRPTTVRSYRQHIDAYLIPHLGRLRLGDLRATHVEKMLRDIAAPPVKPKPDEKIPKGAKRNPKPLSPATIRRVHATLRSALTSAKRKHLVGHNAAENLELPRAPRPKVTPWEPEELGRFLDYAGTDRLGSLFEVMAMTGLRRGEAAGLRWQDVDLTRGTITVRQQLVEIDGSGVECPSCKGEHRQYRFGRPKTASGEDRVVDLDQATVGVLLSQKLAQDTERAAWGEAYSDHGLVFAREDGTPIPPSTVSSEFARLCDGAGLRHIRLHDLRHGQASLMLAAGVPIAVVSKRLGHSSISITSDTYSHLLGGVGAQAAEAAASLVPRNPRDHSVTTEDDPNLFVPLEFGEMPGSEGGAGGARTHDQRIMSPRL